MRWGVALKPDPAYFGPEALSLPGSLLHCFSRSINNSYLPGTCPLLHTCKKDSHDYIMEFSQQSLRVVSIIISILQMEKLRLGEVK